MTTARNDQLRHAAPRIGLAPFGRHSRYMLAGYLRHVLIVTSILLAIALTIDLWPQFQDVAARGHDRVFVDQGHLHRTPQLGAEPLPGLRLLAVSHHVRLVWSAVLGAWT